MTSDADLLQRFAATRADDAFAEVVQRHVNFVYATALRQVRGDVHLAEDITQRVFIDLARKSRRVAAHRVLAGWLHTSTRYAAAQAIRSEQRRRHREQEAHAMNASEDTESSINWAVIEPLLDDVLARLKSHERDAILLRFFEHRSFAEVGERLDLTETGARSCVDRALDKIHGLLLQRGITSSAAALAIALANQPIVAAPAGMVATITGASVASALGASAVALIMSKTAFVVLGAVAIGSITIGLRELRANRELHTLLNGETSATSATTSISGSAATSASSKASASSGAGLSANATAATTNNEDVELVVLRQRFAQLTQRPNGVVDSEIKPPQNVGRATPKAAAETMMWAVLHHDAALAGTFYQFLDDTPENREKFMARFSETIRNRYPTPEEICVAGNFGIGPECHYSADDGMQIYSEMPSMPPGAVEMQVWNRHNGAEYGSNTRVVPTKDGGWAVPLGLTQEGWIRYLQSRLDPETGNFVWNGHVLTADSAR